MNHVHLSFLCIYTGHGTLIGQRTGKVLGYAVKSKTCRICYHARARGKMPRVHNCKKNWTGSSKGMEPAMAVDILRQVKTKGCNVSTLVMDGDSVTINRCVSMKKALV